MAATASEKGDRERVSEEPRRGGLQIRLRLVLSVCWPQYNNAYFEKCLLLGCPSRSPVAFCWPFLGGWWVFRLHAASAFMYGEGPLGRQCAKLFLGTLLKISLPFFLSLPYCFIFGSRKPWVDLSIKDLEALDRSILKSFLFVANKKGSIGGRKQAAT